MGEVKLGVDEFYESRWREANTPLPDCLQISRDLSEKELECHDVRRNFWLKVMFGDGKYVSVSYHPRESKSIRAALFSPEGCLEELVNSDARIPRRGEVKTVTVCNQTDRPIFLEYDLQHY